MTKFLISALLTVFSEISAGPPSDDSIADTVQPDGGIVVNELMYAPAGGEPEWVEFHNASAQDIDIRGYMISDATVTSKHLIASGALRVFPGENLVLTRDSTALAAFRFGLRARVVSVAGFPTLNNGGDALFLYDSRGEIVDSLLYSPGWGGASGGRSLERVDPTGIGQDELNWGSCVAVGGGTPGEENSIARKAFDLTPLSARVETNADASVDLVGVVWNGGYQPSSDALLSFYDDKDGDSSPSEEELLARIPFQNHIAPLDSQALRWRWNAPAPGDHTIILVVNFGADERYSNDTCRSSVRIAAPEGSLIINEIMYAPLAGGAEYVELMNGTGQSVNIAGWRIADRGGGSGTLNSTLIPAGRHFVPPGGLCVVASDSALFRFFPGVRDLDSQLVIIPRSGLVSLNNDGDAVVVRDPSGNAVDSVAFSPAWHNPAVSDRTGRSLERILARGRSNDATNWSSCGVPQGGTPGQANSVGLIPSSSTARLSFSPNPFSPDNDGIDEATVVHYVLPRGVWMVHIMIFDVRGRLIRRLAMSVPCVGQGDVVWDGRDDQRVTARIGMYIVFIEALDEQRGETVTGKAVVVLAGEL